MKFRKVLLRASIGLTLGILTGCLAFERQTMSWRHDPASDTLWIFQDYQGIFGDDDVATLSGDEKDQLITVMQGERTFFFNNWITEFNRERLQEQLQRPRGELDPDPEYEASIRTLIALALANVKIENVGFYFNADQRLCGAQQVTVRNISKVLAALNTMLVHALRENAAKEDVAAEEKRVMIRFANLKTDMVRLKGNRLEIRFPLLEKDYLKFKDESPQGIALSQSGGNIQYRDEVLTLGLGAEGADFGSVTLPFSDKPYSGNAVAQARAHGIKEAFDPVRAAKAFLKPDP
jgi:hypothetical protein